MYEFIIAHSGLAFRFGFLRLPAILSVPYTLRMTLKSLLAGKVLRLAKSNLRHKEPSYSDEPAHNNPSLPISCYARNSSFEGLSRRKIEAFSGWDQGWCQVLHCLIPNTLQVSWVRGAHTLTRNDQSYFPSALQRGVIFRYLAIHRSSEEDMRRTGRNSDD